MKRTASLLGILMALSASSCNKDNDDDSPVRDGAAMDAPTADGSTVSSGVPGMCHGVYDGYSRKTLGESVQSGGQCTKASDLDVICDNDIVGITTTCGTDCLLTGKYGPFTMVKQPELTMCTSDCAKAKVMPGLSDPCLQCYAQVVTCTTVNCALQCALDTSGKPCQTCQVQKGCLAAFSACSGVPAPQRGSGPDGGASLDAVVDQVEGDSSSSVDSAVDQSAVDSQSVAGVDGAALSDGGVPDAATDGGAFDAAADGGTSDAAADGSTSDAATD
jgi:hypothetical protein